MYMIAIQLFFIVCSLVAVGVAFHEMHEERQAWKEDEAMMSGWLKERNDNIARANEIITNCLESHNKWLEGAKANGAKLKKEIACLKGQNTRLKKKLEALK